MFVDKDTTSSVKLGISLRPDLYKWVAAKSIELGLSRSALIAMAITQYKQALEMQPKINGLMESVTSLVQGYVDGSLPPDVAQMKLAELDSQYSEFRKK